MSAKKETRSKGQFAAALALERTGETSGAIKLYEKAAATDPANSHAWNRQMVLYRKTRSKEEEVNLIKMAIVEYQKAIDIKQQDWLRANQTKADSSRELANILGLLEPTGLPKKDDATVEKWQTRLYLLEYRIKNARKKKTSVKTATKKLNRATSPAFVSSKINSAPPATIPTKKRTTKSKK